MSELRANAESWDSPESDEHSRTYLAPAFRGAIPLLEKNGADALPILLTATFGHGFDVPTNIAGWSYVFCWLETGGQVRGFYLRSEGEPDVDLYPALFRGPQVTGTAWFMDGGPVLLSEKERSRVPAQLKGSVIVVDARVLARKKVLVGLILADGRKAPPIEAYIREGDKRWFNGQCAVPPEAGVPEAGVTHNRR
jgi:hypothetical protein